MRNTGIIAFCGSKGAGKDTSHGMFAEIATLPTEQIALAGHLKEATSRVFNIDMKYFTDQKLKEVELETYVVLTADHVKAIFKEFDVVDYDYDKHVRPHIGKVLYTPRALLQYIGTEVLHPIDPLIHAKKVVTKKSPDKLTIITDLRFLNEFNFLKETLPDDFIPVYVKNSRAETMAAGDTHPSEKELQLFKNKCFLLDNEGTLGDLRNNIQTLIKGVYA